MTPNKDRPKKVQLSVVIATFNRLKTLRRLLTNLEQQTLSHSRFQVIVVDDGSRIPVSRQLESYRPKYRLQLLRQPNSGVAVARHFGIDHASGDIIVIVDDDMALHKDFLEQHLKAHQAGAQVVLGQICPSPRLHEMPLFERFHAQMLARFVADVGAGRAQVRGTDLCTGNVSFRRQLYHQVGGFDPELKRSEDAELGIRLEKGGADMRLEPGAKTIHHSDHTDLEFWLKTGFRYGLWDTRIARKHSDMADADPWRFFFMINRLSRPFVISSMLLPQASAKLSRGVMWIAGGIDKMGVEKPALAATTLAYGIEYFRGMRHEAGSPGAALAGYRDYKRKRQRHTAGRDNKAMSSKSTGALGDFIGSMKEDFGVLRHYRAKYNRDEISALSFPGNMVKKIGLQMAGAIRVMQFFRDSRTPLLPQVSSRMIRHLYGAEIHWDAQIEPGLFIVHGNGLVISHAAKIGKRCILFHNVTLGEGRDAKTGKVGAPVLEEEVHIGPGATLIGPITVGKGTKIMAGAVLDQTVPPYSLVRPGASQVSSRKKQTDAKSNTRKTAKGNGEKKTVVEQPAGRKSAVKKPAAKKPAAKKPTTAKKTTTKKTVRKKVVKKTARGNSKPVQAGR